MEVIIRQGSDSVEIAKGYIVETTTITRDGLDYVDTVLVTLKKEKHYNKLVICSSLPNDLRIKLRKETISDKIRNHFQRLTFKIKNLFKI